MTQREQPTRIDEREGRQPDSALGPRVLKAETVAEVVAGLVEQANLALPPDVEQALVKARETEDSLRGKQVLRDLVANLELARRDRLPICQDTGIAVVFVEVGEHVSVTDPGLSAAITEGVRMGYTRGYLRMSVVADPLRRVNTRDNTPPVIHYSRVPGTKLVITVAPKGAGSENMSALAMLPPSAGWDGVRRFVVDHVSKAGANPCPPVVVGVGLGGNFELVAVLAKKALLRPLGQPHPDPFYAEREAELLREINSLGIGPEGFGGSVTALGVAIEAHPCHIASLPVAVNLNCHAARHATAEL